MMKLALALTVVIWPIVTSTSAGEVPPQTRKPIDLTRCRIKLIDKVTLASDRPGILRFVEPKEGDPIKRDQPVAGLQDDVPRAKLARATKEAENDIEVRFSTKAAEVAKNELEQAILVNKDVADTIPGIEISRLRLAKEKSVLQIEQAQHSLDINKIAVEEASAELKTYEIPAPFSGTVTRVFKKKGEAVRQGDPIMEVVNTERLRAEGHVEISDIWSVQVGDSVEVYLDIPDVDLPVEKEKFTGRIVFIDVEVEPVTRRVKVWADLVNRGGLLRAGLTANMKILPTQPKPAALKTTEPKSEE
jgi:multidrug resistance efflux pump